MSELLPLRMLLLVGIDEALGTALPVLLLEELVRLEALGLADVLSQ